MSMMVIALGLDDQPQPGNAELPYYNEVRQGLHEVSSRPHIFSAWMGPTPGLGLTQEESFKTYELRTSWKDGYLFLGRMPQKLKHQMAVMFARALSLPGIDTLVLKRPRRHDIFVTQLLTDEATNIFNIGLGGH